MELNESSFIAALALFQNKRDSAIGLSHLTTKQKGLLWYFNTLQAESYSDVLKKSFYFGVIKSATSQIKALKEKITSSTTLDEAQAIYAKVMELQTIIDKSAGEIHG